MTGSVTAAITAIPNGATKETCLRRGIAWPWPQRSAGIKQNERLGCAWKMKRFEGNNREQDCQRHAGDKEPGRE
jgi:hypothetical protein